MQHPILTIVALGAIGAAAAPAPQAGGLGTAETRAQAWYPASSDEPAPPSARPPLNTSQGPRAPHAPLWTARPAGWPGTPVPSYTASNGDTIVGSAPGEAVVSDAPDNTAQAPAWRSTGPGRSTSGMDAVRRTDYQSVASPGLASGPASAWRPAGSRDAPYVPRSDPGMPMGPPVESAGAPTYPTTESRRADDAVPLRYPSTADRYRPAPQAVAPAPAGRSSPVWAPSPAERDVAAEGPRDAQGNLLPAPFGPRMDRFQPPPSEPLSEPPPTEPRPVLYERAEALARVGTEVILAAEVTMGLDEARARTIEGIRAKAGGRVPPEMLEELDRQVKEAIRKRLEQKVQVALICQHAAREIPAENLKRIREIVGREFEKRETPEMMKMDEARSRRELEDKLLAKGMSLEARKREWIDQALAADWLRQQVRPNTDISHDDMLAYYHSHAAEFERPAKARWEQLTVRVSKYASREEARAALAEMGNLVLRGAPLAEVAKDRSDGPTAMNGGLRDWTSRGSLTAEVLERAIFGLPVGELSPILEEEKLMHIVRVVERQDAHRKPFAEAQAEIREKIGKERQAEAREAFLAKLRQQIPVWTVFDEDLAKHPPTR